MVAFILFLCSGHIHSALIKEVCPEQTLQETRNLMADLSSSSMVEIGLSAAISEWLEEKIAKQHNLSVEFTEHIKDLRLNLLEDHVRVLLFRNVRELIANSIKHARAKRVSVSIFTEENLLKISVKDDGIGFDPEKLAQKNRQDGEHKGADCQRHA